MQCLLIAAEGPLLARPNVYSSFMLCVEYISTLFNFGQRPDSGRIFPEQLAKDYP